TAQGFPPVPEGADPALRTKPAVGKGDGALTKLAVTTLIKGTGAGVIAGQQVTVNYVGVSYKTGEEFDSSWKRQQTFDFQVGAGRVIKGWDEGLVGVTGCSWTSRPTSRMATTPPAARAARCASSSTCSPSRPVPSDAESHAHRFRRPRGMRIFVRTIALLAGIGSTAVGIWALTDAEGFASWTGFGPGSHYVHDIGAFQLGIGVSMLLALLWTDALAVVLAAFLVGNTAHAWNHAADADLGGRGYEPYAFAAVSVLVLVALIGRLRELGWVVGDPGGAASPDLAPFARQKTALLTTYRRDGSPVGTPLSIAVAG